MNFVPVIIINLILLVITILLAIADRLLVTYGQCKITVHQEDDAKEFSVEGGSYLLSNLTENGIDINSSCGGKGTCGYCKVKLLSGGGPILPTEEIFMSREEKDSGVRLACQVKVKEDIEVYIPDLLTTVRNIVKNKTYDTRVRWQIIKTGQQESVSEKPKTKVRHHDKTRLHQIFEEYQDAPGAIVPILQRINDTFNYLPEPALRLTSENLKIPLSHIYRIATFYNAFSLEPRGKHLITICLGTACHVKGANNILSALEETLGIKTGQTTKDMMFTLESVRCLGCCGLAPVVKIGEDVHGLMTANKVPKLIEMYGNS